MSSMLPAHPVALEGKKLMGMKEQISASVCLSVCVCVPVRRCVRAHECCMCACPCAGA